MRTQASGPTGGTEMAAVYGLLMRYDDDADRYVPELAESLTESDDRLRWTLTLPESATFSDGTAFDAEAVIAALERYNDGGGANSQQFTGGVAEIEAADERTVMFHLVQPWREFPALLTFGHGLIPAPAAYADAEEFAPIGAGAFTVESFAPGQSLSVRAREDYVAGAPYLDGIDFVDVTGDQGKLDTVNSGGVDMAHLRAAEQVVDARDQGLGGYIFPASLADVLQINNRAGRPGHDPQIRRVIALALDPEVFIERSKQGHGSGGKELFQAWSQWGGQVDAVPVDPAEATDLVAAAVEGGFDGRLVCASLNNPSSRDIAVSVKTMLDAVGFDVDIRYAATTTDLVQQMYVDHDFDPAYGGNSTPESMPVLRLADALDSASTNNVLGYASPEMDELLAATRAAETDDEVRAALARIQEQVNTDAPYVPLGAGGAFVVWSDAVHGVKPSPDGIILFDRVWMDR